MMKSTWGLAGLLVLPFLAVASPAIAEVIVIHDQTFDTSNWDVIKGNGTNFSSVSYSRSIGAGVTGDAQLTVAYRTSGASSFTYEVEHYKKDVTFTPATQGSIQSIGWQLWYKFQGTSTYGALQLLARQGAGCYLSSATFTEPQNQSAFWQKASGTIAPSSFSLFRGSGPATLDFSAGAAPIEFGYMNSSSVFLSTPSVTYSASFFDLQITAIPVPEPTSLAAVASLLASTLVVGRWRRR